MSDELTATLAIIGAATGLGSLAIQSAVTYRDRLRLRLHAEVTDLYGKAPRIVIDVVNDSPRPATVREVGLYARPVRIAIRPQDESEEHPGIAEIDFPFSEGSFLMEPHEMRQFAGFPDIFREGIHADQPLRLYATDERKRRVWGSAAPYVRLMLKDTPPIEDEMTKWSLTPDGETREPWPVEPRWKLWKRSELRRSTKDSRTVAKQQKEAGTLRLRGGVKRFDPEEGLAPTEAPG